MAMSDATKRKEPEAETPAPATEEAKEKAEEKKEPAEESKPKPEEPDAKKQKTAPAASESKVEPKQVRKQVEYYLSDENLRHDKFFHEKISSDSEGWLDMSLILSCNKMKAMKASKEDVVSALKESKLELKEDGVAVRRPGKAALPQLEAKPQFHQKKSSLHAHDGGAIIVFKGIPAEQSWMQVKDALKAKLPGKSAIWNASPVDDKGQCFVVAQPFEGDLAFFKDVELELGGAKVKCEVCYNEQLQQTLKTLPKHIRDKREKEAKRRQKDRGNKPIILGTQRFLSVGALRGKVKEILNSRSDGEQLKKDGTDYKFITALLEFHPKGKEKTGEMVGLKVAKSAYSDSRCFYMVKEDGTEEDVSMKKCIDAVEANPPYVKVEKKEVPAKTQEAAKSSEAKDAKPAEEKKADAAELAKPADSKPVTQATEAKPAEDKKVEAAEAAKPVETKPTEDSKPVTQVTEGA